MAAVAINYFAYNFIKIHRSLRMSPAMAAGVVDRLFDVSDLVNLLIESESKKAAYAVLDCGLWGRSLGGGPPSFCLWWWRLYGPSFTSCPLIGSYWLGWFHWRYCSFLSLCS